MGSFKLGKMTFGSLFKKPETVRYPEEKKQPPAGLKGHVEIDVGTCILCGICAKRCPCGAIEVRKPDRAWSIDRFRCVQCGTCVRECPKACLSMDPAYAPASTAKHRDDFTVPEREKPASKASAEPTAAEFFRS